MPDKLSSHSINLDIYLPSSLFPVADLNILEFFQEANLLTKPMVLSSLTRDQNTATLSAAKLSSLVSFLRDIAEGNPSDELSQTNPILDPWIYEGRNAAESEVIEGAVRCIVRELEKSMRNLSDKYWSGWRRNDTCRMWNDAKRYRLLLKEFAKWNKEKLW